MNCGWQGEPTDGSKGGLHHNDVHLSDMLSLKSRPRLSGSSLASTFVHIWSSKLVRGRHILTLLSCEHASRHNGMHFFRIWNSKSGPRPSAFSIFAPFYLRTCFAPQRRALFRHLNFQKRCETVSLTLLTCECVSHHNGKVFRAWCDFEFEMRFVPQPRALLPLSASKVLWNFPFQTCFGPQRRALF